MESSSQTTPYDPYPTEMSGIDPLYGQSVNELTEHDQGQYKQFKAQEDATRQRIAQEQLRKNELERSVFISAQKTSLGESLRKIKKPSFTLYSLFIGLMGLTDLIDVFDFTGVGIIINRIIQVAVLFVSMLVAWHSGHKIKSMSDVHSDLSERTSQIAHRISVYRQRYAKALRMGRKLGLLKKGSAGAKLVTKLGKVTKFTRSPMLKSATSNLLEFSPFGFIPWQTVFAWWTYHDHKSAYVHTSGAIPEFQQTQTEEASEFSESQIALYESLTEDDTVGEVGQA